MSHPYDASTKYLIENRLADWLPLTGHATKAKLEIIPSDLSTITAAADRVLKVCEDPPWLLHFELQAGRDRKLLFNLPAYGVLLRRRHGMLVRTVVVLLRESADWPELNGTIQAGFAGEPPYLVFHYQVVRLWQLPPDIFLNGGLGVLPLATLSAVSEAEMPSLIRRMDERIRSEASPDEGGKLWTAADVLMGLRFSGEFVNQLLQGVRGMKESVTYQAIVEEGEAQGLVKGMIRARRDDLLLIGEKRFGAPGAVAKTALQGISDPDRLSRMVAAIFDASTWDDLLAVE
jgi:predicted transposase YdaD